MSRTEAQLSSGSAGSPNSGGRKPGARLLALGWPLVISFWLRQAFSWIDRIYAASLDGQVDAAQAAISLAVPLEFLMIALWVGSSNALTSLLSEAMGAGDDERVEDLLRTMRRIVLALGVSFLGLATCIWFFYDRFGLDAQVASAFRVYATVLIGGSAFTAFWSILPDSLVKAHQDTKTTMWAGIASSVVNVALNTVFVFVFHWGLFGIGLSTALGRLAGFFYAQYRAAAHEHGRRAASRAPSVGRRWAPALGALLAIAIPSSLTYVLMATEGFLINGILASGADSKARLAGFGIFDSTLRFLAMPPIAIGVALLPLAGRLRGEGRLDELSAEVRAGVGWVLGYSLLFVAPLGLLFAGSLADALLSEPAAREHARLGMRWLVPGVFSVGLVFFLRPLFDALGAATRGLLMSAIRSLGFIVPGGFLGERLAQALGLAPAEGFYSGLVLGMLAGAVAFGLAARGKLNSASG